MCTLMATIGALDSLPTSLAFEVFLYLRRMDVLAVQVRWGWDSYDAAHLLERVRQDE
jgi:hypothetical protein